VIWFRAAFLAALVGIAAAALTQAAPQAVPTVEPTPRPTRVPLPTLAPETIISRISRATPEPPRLANRPALPEVQVVDYGFSPAQMRVNLGATVTFANSGNDGHDVTGTGPGGEWRSGPLALSERYSRQFNLVGTYSYVCTIHPEMRGSIVVVQP
jgi:plastocyanin